MQWCWPDHGEGRRCGGETIIWDHTTPLETWFHRCEHHERTYVLTLGKTEATTEFVEKVCVMRQVCSKVGLHQISPAQGISLTAGYSAQLFPVSPQTSHQEHVSGSW